jgi:hypothetical protein
MNILIVGASGNLISFDRHLGTTSAPPYTNNSPLDAVLLMPLKCGLISLTLFTGAENIR